MQLSHMSQPTDPSHLGDQPTFHPEDPSMAPMAPMPPFHQQHPALTPSSTETSYPPTFTNHYTGSDDSIPTSLASKLNNFYLQTPTVAATPVFNLSPTFVGAPSMPTPSVVADNFHSSPEFIAGGGPSYPYEGVGTYPRGLQLTFMDPHQMGPGMGDHDQVVGHPDMHPAADMVPRMPIHQPGPHDHAEMMMVKSDDSDTVTQTSTQSMDYMSFKGQPSSDESGPTIEELLQGDPFADLTNTADPVDSIVEVDERDAVMSSFLDFDELVSSPTPDTVTSFSLQQTTKKQRSSKSPTPKQKPIATMKVSMLPAVKQLRKLKSFTTGIKHHALGVPAFSLEECLNEFHIAEGNYAFEDETARLSMKLGPGLHSSITKRKSSSKLPKALTKPLLRKAKTTTNLCLHNAFRNSPKVLKNMESGLVSFKLNLNNASQD